MKNTKAKEQFIDINAYFIIESLLPNETKTGKNLYFDSVSRRVSQLGLQAAYYGVNSKQQFIDKMEEIENYVAQGCVPYIHFEIHGSKEGFHFNNGEAMSWDEFFKYAVAINEPLRNKLIMSLATCYGSYMFNMVDPFKRSPFLAFIAPMKAEYSSDLEIDFLEYFDRLLTEKDFGAALAYMFGPNAKINYFFMTSTMLFENLKAMNYLPSEKKAFSNVWNQIAGKQKFWNRSESRKWLRRSIKNRPAQVRKYRDHFLMKDLY